MLAVECFHILESIQQQQQQCLLRVQPVLRLIEHYRLRRVHHCICNFFIAARRKAVHKHRVRLGLRHQRFVYLEGPEDRRDL